LRTELLQIYYKPTGRLSCALNRFAVEG